LQSVHVCTLLVCAAVELHPPHLLHRYGLRTTELQVSKFSRSPNIQVSKTQVPESCPLVRLGTYVSPTTLAFPSSS
jgi:hypothetical protein